MLNSISDIFLDEASHTYILHDDPDFKFTSCTTFVSLFFKPFDSIGIANKLTSTHSNYIGMTPQQLVKSWEQTAIDGTRIHSEIEKHLKGEKPVLSPGSKLVVQWLKRQGILVKRILPQQNLSPEVIVYSKELRIAGTVDLLVRDTNDDTYNIYDWKTTKKIVKWSYKSKCGICDATKEIYDCNFSHYSLQLSLYKYILEMNYNIKIKKIFIVHLDDYRIVPYECDYLKATIEAMFIEDIEFLKQQHDIGLTKKYKNE